MSRATWHLVAGPEAYSRKPPHLFFFFFFSSPSPLPAHCLWHRISCTSSSALSEHRLLHTVWDEKITAGAERLHRKQINHQNLNQGIYFPILSLSLSLSPVFHCSGPDPRWWMMIIYSTKPDIYLTWLHLMCSFPLFTRYAFIYIVTVWIECVIVMGYMQE